MDREVWWICEAYESGYGHGYQNDGLDSSRTPFSDPKLQEAYQIGYDNGQEAYMIECYKADNNGN